MSIFPAPSELKAAVSMLLLFAASLPVLAAPAIYDVEVVIFSNSTSGDNGEQWTRPAGVSIGTGAFRNGEFTELARSLYRLNGISNALQQSSGYRVLFHRAWRQVASGRDTAAAYPVQSLVTGGDRSIEGSIRLVLGRYLHLDVDLFQMSARGAGGAVYSDDAGSVPVYELKEQRRIRSGELHYFDHPRFGMIAQVTPYAAPEAADTAGPVPEAAAPTVITEPLPAPVDDQLTR